MPPLTLGAPSLLIASIVLFSLAAWASKGVKQALILLPHRVRERGHVHRLVTAGWIHADLPHLLFNVVTLYVFGDYVVRALGQTEFLVLYGSAVVLAFVPTTLRHMREPKYATLGASGAIAAVMLSAVLTYPELKLQLLLLPIPMPALAYAGLYLVYSVWQASTSAKDGVNHEAHFFGAVYGAIFTYAFQPARVDKTLRHFVTVVRHLVS